MKRTKILFVTLVVALLLGGFGLTAGATGDEDAVRVDVVKEIQTEDELVVYKVRVPEFAGLADLDFQGQLNETILDRALEDVETVESQAEEFAVLAEIFIDFDVKSSGDILSLVVNNYMYTGGANGITRIDTYNIDTKNCVILGIADLFKPASEYEEVINKGIRAQIKDKVENEDATFFTGEDGFVTISDEQDFYIEDNDLVILFQKYDIAPGVMG
ncbi:MAG TPA: DUF3298 and DUF4163 domain-containing protein, partial [Clostridia bacterium]|nr:DUF3298 and DUF4163 domain-containing protein [Clostridia bacterium]